MHGCLLANTCAEKFCQVNRTLLFPTGQTCCQTQGACAMIASQHCHETRSSLSSRQRFGMVHRYPSQSISSPSMLNTSLNSMPRSKPAPPWLQWHIMPDELSAPSRKCKRNHRRQVQLVMTLFALPCMTNRTCASHVSLARRACLSYRRWARLDSRRPQSEGAHDSGLYV